jgi:hypothetical protein
MFRFLARLARRILGRDEDHHIEIGEPRPIGRKGREAGVWLAFDLDGKPLAYIVGTGRMMMEPIAEIFGSEDEPLSFADFQLAVAIAKDWDLAYTVPGKCLDLRGCRPGDMRYEMLLDLVLFPTNKKGHHAPQKVSAGCLYTAEGFYKALCPSRVRWSWNKRYASTSIPTFEMQADGPDGWSRAPENLVEYLDEKKSGRTAVDARLPGQLPSTSAEATALEALEITGNRPSNAINKSHVAAAA